MTHSGPAKQCSLTGLSDNKLAVLKEKSGDQRSRMPTPDVMQSQSLALS